MRQRFSDALLAQDYPAATVLGRQLVAADPGQPVVWFNLGYSLRMLRRFEPALDAYQRAVMSGLDRPEDAYVNRAHILIEHLQRPDQAQADLEAAISANPRSLGAMLSLGQLHEDLGRISQAEETYRRALGIFPDCGRALARWSGLVRMTGDHRGAMAALQKAIGRLAPGSDDFAEVAMAIGKGLEADGNFRDAMEAYTRANQAALAATPPSLRYDAAASSELAAQIIAAEVPKKLQEEGRRRRGPIFICGMFRSGSTLLESILARHPRVTSVGELETVPALVASIPGYPERVAGLSEDDLERLRATYWAEVDLIAPGAEIVIDKRPDNFLHLGLIRRLFPDSPILHTERNPDDVAISIFGNLFGPAVPYASRWEDIGHWQDLHRRVMDHWRRAFGDAIADVDYRDLVGDVTGTMRGILEFCELPWSDDITSSEHAPVGVRTMSQWQVRRPVHRDSLARAENFLDFMPRN